VYIVLYVDDEPGLLEVGKIFLEQGGQFTVDTIDSAPAALVMMKSKNYDAIIADYQMPVMDGIEFLKKVRGSGDTVPFILFTGRGREEVVIQALNEGADFYLQKGGDPVAQFTELAHQVRQAVQQRRAEISIRDLERREADIINFLPDATFAIDRSGHIIAWNHAIEEMTGVSAAEMLGKGNYEYAIPFYGTRRKILIDLIFEPDEDLTQQYGNIIRERDTLIVDSDLPRPKGQNVTLYGKAGPLYNRQGEIIGAIQSIRDITEMKKAEEEVRAGEEKYRLVVENSHDTIYIYRDNLFLFVNTKASELTGYSHDELMKKEVWDLIHPDDRNSLRESGQRRISGEGIPSFFTARILTKTGKVRTGEFFVDRIIYQGQPAILGIVRDITERKRAEEEIRAANEQLAASAEELRSQYDDLAESEKRIRESEERFRSIFESSPYPIAISNQRTGKYIFTNAAFQRMSGYPEEEIMGKDAIELGIMTPEDLERRAAFYQSKEKVEGELFTIIKKGGTTKSPVLISFIPITVNYEPAVLTMAVDITERKHAEEALRESEQRYRNVVEDQTEFISRFLPDGTHVFVNEAYCRYFGLKRDEILGHRFRPNIPAEDQKLVKQFFESLTPDNPVDSIEHRIIMPDEEIRWQRWSDRAIFDPSGTITEYQSVGRDITDRKQEEQALHENEQRLASIYNTVGDAIFQLTVEPDEQYRFTSINSAFSRITGLPSGQVVGRKVNEVIPEPSLSLVREKYRQAIREKAIVRWEETSSYPTGQLIGEVSISPIFDKAGTCTHLIGSVHDITERKRAEEALRESEAKYRLLADTSPEMIYLVDPEGCIQYVNTSSARVFRTTPEDLIGKHIADLFPPDVARHHLESIRKVISTRQPVIHEIADVLPLGKIWIEVRLSPVIDHKNGVIGVLGLSNDITQRKSAEEALRKSEVRFRTIFENQQTGLIMVDAETHVIMDANSNALSLFGATSEDVTGRVCHTFICPAEEGKCPVTDLGQTVDMSERILINKKGERIPVIKSVSRVNLGDRTFLIESFTDITERKRAEEALRASEEKYRGIFENTTVAVFQTRIDGSIATANMAFARLLGYETPEMAIRDIPNIRAIYVNPDLRDNLYQMLVTRGAVEDFEFALKRRDGSILWASVNVRAVYGDDRKITGLEGLAVDITERKKTEEALRDVNKKLNLLSKITRHDINNQLMVLQGYLKILEKKKPGPSFTPQFQKVETAAQRISSMIQFTKEYEEIGINAPVWQDCNVLADTAVTQVPLGDIMVKNDLPRGTEVFADPLIVRVFYNLMDNAIRYAGKITTIRFFLQESGDDHLIVCEDDGNGVPAAEKERIFERDFGRNTGLGLFLSREILGITGITIRENGIPGKGARFEMAVPKDSYRFTGTKKE
jgi:PAS domain S-box-containing protein